MKTTMDMSSYEIEQDAMEIEYGEEIISAGWDPGVDLVCEQLQQVPTDEQIMVAADITTQNSEDDVSAAYRLSVFQNFLLWRFVRQVTLAHIADVHE